MPVDLFKIGHEQDTQGSEPQRGEPTSTITGKPIPSFEEKMKGGGEVTAGALRYGLPVAAAAIPGLGAAELAITAGVGEMGARGVEDVSGIRQYKEGASYLDKRMSDYLGAMGAAATEYAGTKWIAPLIGAVTRKLIKEPAAYIGKKALAPKALRADVAMAQDTLRPFEKSLTLDQLHQGEKNIVSFLGATSRSGLGSSGMMRKADVANLTTMEDTAAAYLKSLSNTTTRQEFGKQVNGLISGELDFVKAYRNTLYDEARRTLGNTKVSVDLSGLQNFFKREGIRDEVKGVQAMVSDLLPQGKNANWSEVPAQKAMEAVRRINKAYGKNIPDAESGVIDHIRPMLNNNIDRSLRREAPEAAGAFAQAKTYFQESKDRLQNKVAKTVMRQLENYPGTAVSMLGRGQRFMDNLDTVERMFTQTAKEQGVARAGTTLTKEQFEKSVMKPLRYSVMLDAVDKETGRVSGKKLTRVLDRLKDDGAAKIFGKESADALRRLSTTMNVIEQTPSGSKVFIQLVQGGSLVSLAGGIATDEPTVKKIGGAGTAVVFVAPMLLAGAFRNPRFVRALTDGIAKGPASTAFNRALITLTNQYAHQRFDQRNMSPEQAEFYHTIDGNSFSELTEPDSTNEAITRDMEAMNLAE